MVSPVGVAVHRLKFLKRTLDLFNVLIFSTDIFPRACCKFLTWPNGEESLTFALEMTLQKNSLIRRKIFKTFNHEDKNLHSNVFLLIQDLACRNRGFTILSRLKAENID